jgi:hypothetical protein
MKHNLKTNTMRIQDFSTIVLSTERNFHDNNNNNIIIKDKNKYAKNKDILQSYEKKLDNKNIFIKDNKNFKKEINKKLKNYKKDEYTINNSITKSSTIPNTRLSTVEQSEISISTTRLTSVRSKFKQRFKINNNINFTNDININNSNNNQFKSYLNQTNNISNNNTHIIIDTPRNILKNIEYKQEQKNLKLSMSHNKLLVKNNSRILKPTKSYTRFKLLNLANYDTPASSRVKVDCRIQKQKEENLTDR